MDPAGNVYIGGYFNYACGTNYPTNVANNIVKWDPASPTGCSALGTGVDGEVLTLSYDDNAGRLLVGGSFTSAGGSAANNFAIWSASPGSWSSPSQ